MGRAIVKVADRYIVWSSVVDAPIATGMTLDELRKWYRDEYGAQGMRDLPARLERVDERGTSMMHHESATDTMWLNRAGKGETRLTLAQIVDFYVTRDGHGEQPTGHAETFDDDDTSWTLERFLGEAQP